MRERARGQRRLPDRRRRQRDGRLDRDQHSPELPGGHGEGAKLLLVEWVMPAGWVASGAAMDDYTAWDTALIDLTMLVTFSTSHVRTEAEFRALWRWLGCAARPFWDPIISQLDRGRSDD